jgi:hypothetical protein
MKLEPYYEHKLDDDGAVMPAMFVRRRIDGLSKEAIVLQVGLSLSR